MPSKGNGARRRKLDFAQVAAGLLSRFEDVMRELGIGAGKYEGAEYVALNPLRADQHRGSFKINRDSGLWREFADGSKGSGGRDLVALWAYLRQVKPVEALRQGAEFLGMAPEAPSEGGAPVRGRPQRQQGPASIVLPVPESAPPLPEGHAQLGRSSARWAYRDQSGALLGYVYRFETPQGPREKELRQLTLWRSLPGASPRWEWKWWPVPRPLYGLDRLAAPRVLLVEGEKCADAAQQLVPDCACLTWPGGASNDAHVDFTPLAGRTVILWPDNDEPGTSAMLRIAEKLRALSCPVVHVLDVAELCKVQPGPAGGPLLVERTQPLPKGWDVADAIAEGWRSEHLLAFMERPGALVRELPAQAQPEPAGAAGKPAQQAEESGGKRGKRGARGGSQFDLTPERLHFYPEGMSNPEVREDVSQSFDVLAGLVDEHGASASLLLQFVGWDLVTRRIILPYTGIKVGATTDIASRLTDLAFVLNGSDRNLVNFLRIYPQWREARGLGPLPPGRLMERTGWLFGRNGLAYLLTDRVIGTPDNLTVFHDGGMRPPAAKFSSLGTAAQWREQVAALARGNSRLMLGIGAAFAAPLLRLVGAEGRVIHIHGDSTQGKTTLLRVAASVCGLPQADVPNGYMETWLQTANGLEDTAQAKNDALLCLDEVQHLASLSDPLHIPYVLAGGTGKARQLRTGGPRPRGHWRVLVLSSGEFGLRELARIRNQPLRSGMSVRMVEVPAALEGGGSFEDVHGYASEAAFARALNECVTQCYGAPFPIWIEHLCRTASDPAELAEAVKSMRAELLRTLGGEPHGHVERVAEVFALIAVALVEASAVPIPGEGGTLTGWEPGECMAAVRACFRAWVRTRGTLGSTQERDAVAQVIRLVREHQQSWFEDIERTEASHGPKVIEMHGYKEMTAESRAAGLGGVKAGWIFWVFSQSFREKLCAGYDALMVARALHRRGLLERDEGARTYTTRMQVTSPKGQERPRYYRLGPELLEYNEDSEEGAG